MMNSYGENEDDLSSCTAHGVPQLRWSEMMGAQECHQQYPQTYEAEWKQCVNKWLSPKKVGNVGIQELVQTFAMYSSHRVAIGVRSCVCEKSGRSMENHLLSPEGHLNDLEFWKVRIDQLQTRYGGNKLLKKKINRLL